MTKAKKIEIDGIKIKVELIGNVEPQDIPTELTGSNPHIKCKIDEVLK